MQTPSRIRPHKTAAEKAQIVAAYLHSDLTQKEFAARQGIGFSTFQRWLREPAPAPQTPGPEPGRVGFLEVPNFFAAKPVLPTCRVHFPRGVVLEVAAGFPPDELRALAQLLQAL